MSARIRSWLFLTVVASTSLALAGCSVACAEANQTPPHVNLDASAWFDAHPKTRLEACLDGSCQMVSGPQPVVKLGLPAADQASPGKARALTVIPQPTTAGRAVSKHSTIVALRSTSIWSPCGTQVLWSADVTVSGDGVLAVAR